MCFVYRLPLFLVVPFGEVSDPVPLPEQMLSPPMCPHTPGWVLGAAGPGWAEHPVGLRPQQSPGQQLPRSKPRSVASPLGWGWGEIAVKQFLS